MKKKKATNCFYWTHGTGCMGLYNPTILLYSFFSISWIFWVKQQIFAISSKHWNHLTTKKKARDAPKCLKSCVVVQLTESFKVTGKRFSRPGRNWKLNNSVFLIMFIFTCHIHLFQWWLSKWHFLHIIPVDHGWKNSCGNINASFAESLNDMTFTRVKQV